MQEDSQSHTPINIPIHTPNEDDTPSDITVINPPDPEHKASRSNFYHLLILVVTFTVCLITIIVGTIIKIQSSSSANTENSSDSNNNLISDDIPSFSDPQPDAPEEPTEATFYTGFLNLQTIVAEWLQTLNRSTEVGLMIYDITNDQVAARYNADTVFSVASIYKLLFAYDGYLQIVNGYEQANRYYTTTDSKGYLTISACLDLIIRESYNGCADTLIAEPDRVARVYDLIGQLNLTNTSNFGLNSTAADLTTLLRTLWAHRDLPETLWRNFSDSLLIQPPAPGVDGEIYDWRQGLPAGFSDSVNVYNKVGWESNETGWNIFCDAAIVDFPELSRTYTVVVLTHSLSSSQQISQLGTLLENYITSHSTTNDH